MNYSNLLILGTLGTANLASGAIVISGTAPTSDVLTSVNSGNIDTALFDEDANANHSRGQLFSLPDGSGTAFSVTAITIRKSQTQAYVNDVLTLRVFEGTQAQWNTGTGHSTATDGSDYYVDTGVTPLFSEAFTVNGSITTGNYVTFELTTPLVVNEDSDFGFFMTYDQVDGTQNAFRHSEGGSGGRLSITTTGHSTSSRNINYFVQGTAIPEPGSTALLGLASLGLLLRRRK